jgi:5-methylthioadenosine/S-adenosylhomocysteine deaminase
VTAAPPEPADLLVEARWIIPVVPAGTTLEHHAVAVRDGRIIGLVSSDSAAQRYRAREVIRLDRHVLMPGLVNTHTHAAMTLLRGFADDMPLMRWLRERIWPAETNHVSPEFVYDGTLLAAAEMVRGGITTANDMYFFPEAAARAFVDSGMRACLGMIALEFPTRYASGADDYLARGLAARDRYRDEPRLTFCLAPHAPYTVSDSTFERVVALAEELDVPIHLHLHETRDEIDESVRLHGVRPLERMRRLGVLSPRLIAVHAIELTESEIELLARHGASVVHCPSSNLKLASGFAPVQRCVEAGVNVALGTDGAASNNRLDMMTEMRIAALLAKAVSREPEAFPAHSVIQAATLDGARALGLEHLIGSIEAGKSADLIAVDFDDLSLTPCYAPASHIVYASERSNVSDVWVAGQRLLAQKKMVDERYHALEASVCIWQNRLVSSSFTP